MTKAIQHNCAWSSEWTIAALETAAECKADVVQLQGPPRGRGGFGISHSADEIRKRKKNVDRDTTGEWPSG